jgi:hypothetical protein
MCGAIITIAHVHHSKPRPQKSDDTSPKEEYFQHMPKTIVKLEIIKKKKKRLVYLKQSPRFLSSCLGMKWERQ